MSEEALQIAEKRKDMKGKGGKERYTHLNVESQRRARRDKKDFLSEQCTEIEGKNRMGKIRDLFKKIRGIKGTFHAKMGTIKNRNDMALQKQKILEEVARVHRRTVPNHDPDNQDGVITHLEPDILECEVKWALESITTKKASGGGGIPVELFQILKDDAVKVLHSIC